MPKKILVIDDEKNIVDIIAFNLKKAGYEVLTAGDGKSGLALALSENPELILLDIMMPNIDGFEVCRRVRERSQVPIIMLTARAEETDKVLGLNIGADDYVTKPFGIKELMARVKANLRHSPLSGGDTLEISDLQIDPKKSEITRHGELLDLTPKEYDLLKFLAEHKGQIFSRETLLEKVWGFEYYGDLRTIDVTIRRIRLKIEEKPETPKYIIAKRGVGYYFEG
ncbi:DNA-binding response regulator [Clostridia bacterium]|nr:DNA-binding response regulator [Clostridia bacterium]